MLSCCLSRRDIQCRGFRDTTPATRSGHGSTAARAAVGVDMRAPSIKRRPAGRRPRASTHPRRRHRPALIGPAALVLAALVAGALILPAGGSAAGGGTGSTTHGGKAGKAGNPFRGNGMWIWYLKKSSGGKLSKIARKAKKHHIKTLY